MTDLEGRSVIRDRDLDTISPSSVVQKLAALSNEPDGGLWVIDDLNRQPPSASVGAVPDTFRRTLQSACREIVPAPRYRLGLVGGAIVVEVESALQRGEVGRVYDVRGNPCVYILRGETVREATKIEVEDLLDAVGKGKYEQSPVADARKTDLDPHLLRRIGLSRDDRDALLQAGILVEDAWWHSQDKPTVAGLMCFGTADFHERHPGFGITVVHSDLGAAESRIHEYREGSQPRRLHRQHAPGHLLSQIQHTVGILVDWMPPFVDGYEVERLFTELVVNAVAHRSLSPTSLQDGGVEVRFFPDEVVIANPGALPLGSVTLIGRDSVRGRLCRNPKLMRLLKERGLALGQGVGLAYVKQVAPTFGRRLELAHVDGSFEARVRVDAELAARVLRSRGPVPVSDRMSPVERRGRIVDLLGEGPMSARELSETLGWPNSTVRAVLRDLLASGTIRRVHRASRSPKQKYRLVGLG